MDIDDLALHVNGPVRLRLAGATSKGGEINGGRAQEFGAAYGLAFDDGQVEGCANHPVVDLGRESGEGGRGGKG